MTDKLSTECEWYIDQDFIEHTYITDGDLTSTNFGLADTTKANSLREPTHWVPLCKRYPSYATCTTNFNTTAVEDLYTNCIENTTKRDEPACQRLFAA